jgi:tetratricopeptide (TPR) repeat protein
MRYDDAIESYDKAIQMEPDRAGIWADKRETLKALGRNTESDEAFAKAKELGYED